MAFAFLLETESGDHDHRIGFFSERFGLGDGIGSIGQPDSSGLPLDAVQDGDDRGRRDPA